MPFVDFLPDVPLGNPTGDIRAVSAATPEAMPTSKAPVAAEDQFGTLKSLRAMADETLWYMGAYDSKLAGKSNHVDPAYKGAFDEIAGTKYEQYWERFSESNNPAYTRALMQQVDAEESNKAVIAASGWAGTATMLGMQLLDPINYIPMANVATKIKGGYAIARTMLEAGASFGAITAAQEALLHQSQITRTKEESAFNIGMGAIMGSVLGAGAHALLSAGERAAVSEAIDRTIASGGQQSVGAAATESLTREQLSLDGAVANTVGRATAVNPALRSLYWASGKAREYTNRMMENTLYLVGHREGVTTGPAAETAIRSQIRSKLGTVMTGMNDIYKNMKRSGVNMSRADFEEAVGNALRNGDVDPNGNVFVSQTAKMWRDQAFQPLFERAIKAGILDEGVEVKTALSYFSRMYNQRMLTAREGEFKTRFVPAMEQKIAERYTADLERYKARVATLEQRIADLGLSPADRVATLQKLKAEGDAFELNNPDHFTRLSEINATRQAAKVAKEAGDSVKAKALLDDAKQKAQDGGEEYSNFVKARASIRARMRNVDQGVAGMQSRQMKVVQQIADLEDKAFRSQRALLARGQAVQKQLGKINDEQIAEQLTRLQEGFNQLVKDSDKALERHKAQIEKIQAEIEQTKVDAKDAKSGTAVRTAQDAEEAVAEIEDRIADLHDQRKALTKEGDKFQAAQLQDRIDALKGDLKKAKGFKAADTKRAEEVNPMTLPALKREIADANQKMVEKIQKAQEQELARKVRLERISERIRVAEQIDPDAMRQAIFEGMDQLALESAGRNMDRGEAAARLTQRFERLDPEKVKAYQAELVRQRAQHEADFTDRWGRKMLGEGEIGGAGRPVPTGLRTFAGEVDALHSYNDRPMRRVRDLTEEEKAQALQEYNARQSNFGEPTVASYADIPADEKGFYDPTGVNEKDPDWRKQFRRGTTADDQGRYGSVYGDNDTVYLDGTGAWAAGQHGMNFEETAHVKAQFNNALVIDPDTYEKVWAQVKQAKGDVYGNTIADWARENGYDGIIINKMEDYLESFKTGEKDGYGVDLGMDGKINELKKRYSNAVDDLLFQDQIVAFNPDRLKVGDVAARDARVPKNGSVGDQIKGRLLDETKPGEAPRPDFTEAARLAIDEVYEKLTGRHITDGDSPRAEYSVPITRGPMKDRTFDFPDELLRGDPRRGETNFLHDNVSMVGKRYVEVMTREIELKERGLIGKEWDGKVREVRNEYADMRQAVAEAASPAEALSIVGKDQTQLEKFKDWYAANRRSTDPLTASKERLLEFLAKDEKAAIEDMHAVRDLLRGTYKAKENASNFARVTRALMAFNYIRQMGGALIANVSEIFRAPMVHGLTSYFRDGIGPLVRNLDAARLSMKEARLAGLMTERSTAHRLMSIAEAGDPYAEGTAFERFMQNATKVASTWNGLSLWTDAMQGISSMMSQHRILEGALQGKDTRLLRYLGIDEDVQARIAEQFRTHGETMDGVMVANTEKWTDDLAVKNYRYAIAKDVDSVIVQRGIGDIPLAFHHPLAKVVLQFRSFALAAHQRVMLRGMQEDKGRFLGGIVAMTTVGMMASAMRAWRSGDEGWDRWKNAASNPGFLVGEGLDLSGIFPLVFEASNTVEKFSQASGAGMLNPVKSPMMALFPGESQQGSSTRFASRDPLSALLGPSAGLLGQVSSALGAPIMAAAGEDPTKRQKKAIVGLVPGSTYPLLKEILQMATGDSPYLNN